LLERCGSFVSLFRQVKGLTVIFSVVSTINFTTMAYTLLFLSEIGGTEILLIFLVVVLLFGGKKIPELMRGLGQGIREFNNAKNSVEDEFRQGMRDADKKKLEN